MDKNEVQKLAKLARVSISDDEAESLSHEFESILNYVGEIKNANVSTTSTPNITVRNVMREDTNPHETGLYSEDLIQEMPSSEGNHLKVKKIL
jgi:aspartyl-tRNA(Asn)/glutamyl-tRNA(Gln) amidotransferase subunit C